MNVKFPWKQIVLGAALALVLTAGLCALVALLVLQEVIPEPLAGVVTRLAVLAMALAVSLTVTKRSGKTRMQVAMTWGAVYLAGCFLLGLALGGQLRVGLWPILVLGICACSGVTASMKTQRRRK